MSPCGDLASARENGDVTFTLSVFDLFTYAVPGLLQLAFLGYVAMRLDLASPQVMDTLPGWLVVTAVAVASYLLGHMTFGMASIGGRLVPSRRRRRDAAWRSVSSRLPKDSVPLPNVDTHVLLAAVELHDKHVAAAISRLRAVGLMLRSATVPFFLTLCAGLLELANGADRRTWTTVTITCLVVVVGLGWQGAVLREWADTKTFESYHWLRLLPAGRGERVGELGTQSRDGVESGPRREHLPDSV